MNNSEPFEVDEKTLSNILTRIHRVQGQLNAIEKMLNEGKDYQQTLIQLSATVSAIESIKNEFIQQNIKTKINQQLDTLLNNLK